MNRIAKNFLESLRAQLNNTTSIATFLESETYLGGQRFSFKGHEFQRYLCDLIEANPGYTLNVVKNSQIGLSEWANRVVLAFMAIIPGASVLVSFPSRTMSQEVLKTRISSIIQESPRLQGLINRDIDSASAKAFLNGSIMYALGGNKQSPSSLLNRPIRFCLIDELDRQDIDIVTGYRSRMTHTLPEKRVIIKISTPTVQGIGIDAEFNESREQHVGLTECNHCGHVFEPDYYVHVKIPGYDEPLLLLTKAKAAVIPIDEAYLECPGCEKAIDKPKLVWRIDINPVGVKKSIGVRLSPFCAPDFISMPDLVESSLTYSSHVEFMNQGLGKVTDLKDSSIQREHIHFAHLPMAPAQHIFSCDMGKLCYFMKGRLLADTTMHVDEMHVIKLAELEEFLEDQHKKTVFSAAVMDSQPYSDLVYRLVKKYQRLYSAIYVSPSQPIPELFKLKLTDKHNEVVRQVSINKGPMMDLMANSLNSFISFEPSPLEGTLVKHLLDIRRVRDYRFEEMIYTWMKSKTGEDHLYHSLVYFFTAAKLAAADIVDEMLMPTAIFKFKHRN